MQAVIVEDGNVAELARVWISVRVQSLATLGYGAMVVCYDVAIRYPSPYPLEELVPQTEYVQAYAAGPAALRASAERFSSAQLDATPIPGTWSARQVVCHIADFEIVYADRMKRVIAEHEPTFFGGDPDEFAAGLAYEKRDVQEELAVIDAVRQQMTRILHTLDEDAFSRIGNHNEAGPLTLAALLQSVTAHLPHHVAFIDAKWNALQ
ncbi:DinB family protein [Roseimaritima ulvae]|uniref:Metal-dependent hydrolase YfiT n=1 Tax=Roseimaritima ulvae TaxID=980254 RepID=A0A5B9QUS4_9BACT|nr:DinB family protein [Roseimaritima ulvae]QEG41719.1 Putative metal-dependent hydrolase YfiT [Roseimaritima ulvae]